MATYVTAGSRPGIGSVVITDSRTGDTYMVAGIGAESDPTITVSVTGVSGTAGVGTLIASLGSGLTGVSATGAIGTFASANDDNITLSGVASTVSVGSIALEVDDNITLSGVSAGFTVGTIALEIDADDDLGGVSATGFIGTITALVSRGGGVFFHAFP